MALKGTKFPKEFTEKVDIRKVNLSSESLSLSHLNR